MADALSVIFRREEIPYTHGIGPGCIAIEINKKDAKRARTALNLWKDAVDALVHEIERP